MKCMQLLKQVKRRRQKLFDVLPKNTGVLVLLKYRFSVYVL